MSYLNWQTLEDNREILNANKIMVGWVRYTPAGWQSYLSLPWPKVGVLYFNTKKDAMENLEIFWHQWLLDTGALGSIN
jgi:hypothetical protein